MQLIIGLMALVLATAAPQSKPNAMAKVDHTSDEAAIQRLTSEFTEALNRGDFKAAAGAWHTTGAYYAIDGQKHSGPGEIEEALSHLTGIKLALKVTDVHWATPDVAVVQGTWQVSGQDVQPPDHGEYSAVISKVGKEWKYAVVRPWVPAAM
jgi:uncharacterized protein (TIGR02246 family)